MNVNPLFLVIMCVRDLLAIITAPRENQNIKKQVKSQRFLSLDTVPDIGISKDSLIYSTWEK